MMKANHGHIVTMASVAGLTGNYKMTDYAATKFATIGYHESLLIELKVRRKIEEFLFVFSSQKILIVGPFSR